MFSGRGASQNNEFNGSLPRRRFGGARHCWFWFKTISDSPVTLTQFCNEILCIRSYYNVRPRRGLSYWSVMRNYFFVLIFFFNRSCVCVQAKHKHRHHRDDGVHKTIRMRMYDARRNARILKLLPAVKVSVDCLDFRTSEYNIIIYTQTITFFYQNELSFFFF